MLFQAENLACRRARRVVFRDIGFALSGGDALLVTGPNGSGKSSLLRILAGLLPSLRGDVRWGGEVMDWADHCHRLHYIGHQDGVKPELTVAEMLDYWQVLQGEAGTVNPPPLAGGVRGGGVQQETPSPAKTKGLLRKPKFLLPLPQGERDLLFAFDFNHLRDTPIRFLSAGQKRRLALARLVMRDVPLWLLDEPTASLDRMGQELLADLLGKHRAKGGVAIIAALDGIDLPDMQHLSLAGGST